VQLIKAFFVVRCASFGVTLHLNKNENTMKVDSNTYSGVPTPIYIIERGSPWNEGLPFWKISVL